MREILVGANDAGQRLDRFLKKYLRKAPLSFIYKTIRKKNVKVNGIRLKEEDILNEGDVISLYLSDETIDQFIREEVNLKSSKFPNIVYEDENIILLDKPAGTLSHNDQKEFQKNMLDMMVDYLIAKGDYSPRNEMSFRPAICNRLDRNTSGILIGAKNAMTLRAINKEIRSENIDKYYLALVAGKTKGKFSDVSYLTKDSKNNKVSVSKNKDLDSLSKQSVTEFETIASTNEFSLLKVNLITGRTHQIRTVLKSLRFPILGDTKYGDDRLNRQFMNKYRYKSQFLHNYKVVFHNLPKELSYLNDKEFFSNLPDLEVKILEDIFGDGEIWKK